MRSTRNRIKAINQALSKRAEAASEIDIESIRRSIAAALDRRAIYEAADTREKGKNESNK